MFEELKLYLDLVEQLGDPFTVFERGWPEDEEEDSESSGHVLTAPFRPAPTRPPLPPAVAKAPPLPPPQDTLGQNPAMPGLSSFDPLRDVGFAG